MWHAAQSRNWPVTNHRINACEIVGRNVPFRYFSYLLLSVLKWNATERLSERTRKWWRRRHKHSSDASKIRCPFYLINIFAFMQKVEKKSAHNSHKYLAQMYGPYIHINTTAAQPNPKTYITCSHLFFRSISFRWESVTLGVRMTEIFESSREIKFMRAQMKHNRAHARRA